MSISLDEFYRMLPVALKNFDYQITDNRIIIQAENGSIAISPGVESRRRIASLTLPVLKVKFDFIGYPLDKIAGFFTAFMRAYQRGGG